MNRRAPALQQRAARSWLIGRLVAGALAFTVAACGRDVARPADSRATSSIPPTPPAIGWQAIAQWADDLCDEHLRVEIGGYQAEDDVVRWTHRAYVEPYRSVSDVQPVEGEAEATIKEGKITLLVVESHRGTIPWRDPVLQAAHQDATARAATRVTANTAAADRGVSSEEAMLPPSMLGVFVPPGAAPVRTAPAQATQPSAPNNGQVLAAPLPAPTPEAHGVPKPAAPNTQARATPSIAAWVMAVLLSLLSVGVVGVGPQNGGER